MPNSISTVQVSNVFVYGDGAISTTTNTGSFDTNTAIWRSATPPSRVETSSPLNDATTGILAGAEEAGGQIPSTTGRYIIYGTRVIGTADDVYSVGQHVVQGNGAEVVTTGAAVAGGASGAYVGAQVGGSLGAATPFPALFVPLGTVLGAGIGAFIGAEAMEGLATTLTGGDYPDKLGPPETLPGHLNLQPTITTAAGDQYALVNVNGSYTWFAVYDNPMLPRYTEVVRGAMVAELTNSYLDAAGFAPQVAQHNAQVTELHRTELREAFRRSETEYANSIGPDGQPWGTSSSIAPNATQYWELGNSPSSVTNTIEVTNGSGSVTRLVSIVDRSTGESTTEYVYEEGTLVAVIDAQGGASWSLNRETGQMELRTPNGTPGAPAAEPVQLPPSYFNAGTALANMASTSDPAIGIYTIQQGDTVTSNSCVSSMAPTPTSTASWLVMVFLFLQIDLRPMANTCLSNWMSLRLGMTTRPCPSRAFLMGMCPMAVRLISSSTPRFLISAPRPPLPPPSSHPPKKPPTASSAWVNSRLN